MISNSFTQKSIVQALLMTAAVAGSALVISPAQAAVIRQGDLPSDGVTNVKDFGFAKVTSSPRPFERKTVGGVTGIGVQGGNVGGEIDRKDNEAITVDFLKAETIGSFDLAFLYDKGVFSDFAGEIAAVTSNGIQTGKLTVLNATSALWSLGGVVTNLSTAGSQAGGGAWRITNPFGNTTVSQLKFAAFPNGGSGGADSDYAFVQLETVPEPTTILGLLAVGALGVGSLKKRKLAKETGL
ncbi:PEP-CTERM sorting domain-containing protein [Phormidesmis sp. 146-35]